jgi:hypothetical protein
VAFGLQRARFHGCFAAAYELISNYLQVQIGGRILEYPQEEGAAAGSMMW